MKNRDLFERMPVPRALATMAVPTIIGQMAVLIYNLADTYFIGRTGNPYMIAAASLVLPLFNLTNAISNFVGVGAGTLVSRLLGAYKDKNAEKVSAFAFYLSLLLGAVFSLLIFLFLDPILRILGSSSGTHAFARSYALCVVVIGGIPTIAQLTLSQLLRAVGCSKQAGFGITMGGFLNVILDPLFMFVIMPPGQEIFGAGIATMLSNLISLIYFLIMIRSLRTKTVLRLSPGLGMLTRGEWKALVSVGIPSGLTNFLFDFSQMMVNGLTSGHGDIALAAIGICLKTERLPVNIGIGICQGMIPIVAYNYSNRNYQRMRGVIRCALITDIAVGLISISIYEIFGGQIIRIFISDPETVSYGTWFIRVRSIAILFRVLCIHYIYVFQAVGKGGTSLFLGILRQLILYAPLLVVMDRMFGMGGILWAEFFAASLTFVLSHLLYLRFNRKMPVPEE